MLCIVVSEGDVVSVMGVSVVGGSSVMGDGNSSTGPVNEHAVSDTTPSCCTSSAAACDVNSDCGPERGREGSVNTAVKVPPGVVGRGREPCFPVRSPIEQAKGVSREHVNESLVYVCACLWEGDKSDN